MDTFPRISIVTPNLNGAEFLEKTITSVTEQGYPNLEYIIIDGGSTDGSLEIIRKYESQITFWESEPDKGLYHAIQKGFDHTTGSILGWINSDDQLLYNSLYTIGEIFSLSPDIDWIQGYPTVMDELGRIVYHRPPVFRPEHFLSRSFHDGRFIQQESTFWTRNLWNLAGGYISPDYQYAGDFELWMRFFRHAPLHVTTAMLGTFRTRSQGQISRSNYHDYLSECDTVIDKQTNSATVYCGKSPKLISYNFANNRFRIENLQQ
jgi:glycosyltransferase involved in cell wall biosynthesis